MSSELRIEKIENSEEVTFSLSGNIDEDTQLDELVCNDKRKIIFDLNNIAMINSCGIRTWVEFQNRIDASVQIVYKNCPQVIIEQINIIKGFVKEGGIIESFYAPYYDNENDEEVKILLKPSEIVDCKAPVKTNDDGDELEFDEIELQYFNFLKK